VRCTSVIDQIILKSVADQMKIGGIGRRCELLVLSVKTGGPFWSYAHQNWIAWEGEQ